MNKNKQLSNTEQIEELARMALGIDGSDEEFAGRVNDAFMSKNIPLLGGLAARLEHYNDHDPSTIDDVIAGKLFMRLAARRDMVSSRLSFMTEQERRVYSKSHAATRDALRNDSAQ